MIKINLLPVRAEKKKETAKQQIAIAIISVVAVLCIAIAAYVVLLTKISAAKGDITRAESELQVLKAKIGEIDNIKKLQDEVKKKLDVLNQLRKGKAGPAKRLAKLSDTLPEKVWLTRYVEAGPRVSIAGIALNEDLIAEYMRNLLASNEFYNVELITSEQTEFGTEKIKLKRFELSCTLVPQIAEPKPAAKK
jgi:type IV pilus assembly protein PilN